MLKIGQNRQFSRISSADCAKTMWDEALRFGEGRTHTLNFIWAEYGVVVPHNKKTPQPFSRFMIWAILTSIFYLKKRFRQQGGQHMLIKIFSLKQASKTEQKRL